jgi:hypothetical protein
MASIGKKNSSMTRYDALMAQRTRRRAIVEHGMGYSDNIRSYISANINRTAAAQVHTTEMQIRSKAQAAAKAKTAALNKLV